MPKKEFLTSLAISIFNIVAAFVAGYLYHSYKFPAEVELPRLAEARQILVNHSIYDAPSDLTLEYGMIRGMALAYGDPYAQFVEPVQHELSTNVLEGVFGGIGVDLQRGPDNEHLLYPYPDSPAAEVGIEAGDILVEADGIPISAETPPDQVIAALRGPVEEQVMVVVQREGEDDPLTFRIERAEFPAPSVSWRLAAEDARLGILKVNIIAASTPDEIVAAVVALTDAGATHFALDLRGNGGGLLHPGIDIARLFLGEGVVMVQEHKNLDTEEFEVEKPGPLADIPLAVFIDHGTASAAEVVAGALQSNERAELIGAPSFGKNTIQSIFTFDDGSSLHVTSSRWGFVGLDFPGDGFGLFPDHVVQFDSVSPNPAVEIAIKLFFGLELN